MEYRKKGEQQFFFSDKIYTFVPKHGYMKKSIAEGMASPYTGGLVYLVEGTEKQTFRGEEYTVYARYYECKDTGEKFTSEEQDEQLFGELYSQYEARHGVPCPDVIKEASFRFPQ